jgi:hypothetical protein
VWNQSTRSEVSQQGADQGLQRKCTHIRHAGESSLRLELTCFPTARPLGLAAVGAVAPTRTPVHWYTPSYHEANAVLCLVALARANTERTQSVPTSSPCTTMSDASLNLTGCSAVAEVQRRTHAAHTSPQTEAQRCSRPTPTLITYSLDTASLNIIT